jgi:hypothetical protein
MDCLTRLLITQLKRGELVAVPMEDWQLLLFFM